MLSKVLWTTSTFGKARQIAAPDGGQGRSGLDAGHAKAFAGQRQRRLARGAPDLQQPGVRTDPSGGDHLFVQLLGVFGSGPMVEVSGRVEGHPQLALISHDTIIALPRLVSLRDRLTGTPLTRRSRSLAGHGEPCCLTHSKDSKGV